MSETENTRGYDALGGEAGVNQAVELFYLRVLDDPQLSRYFEGVNMARLKRHQKALITEVLGGPTLYDGRTLATAHAGLQIGDDDFALVGRYLLGVLAELGADGEVLALVESTLTGVHDDVVSVPSGTPGG